MTEKDVYAAANRQVRLSPNYADEAQKNGFISCWHWLKSHLSEQKVEICEWSQNCDDDERYFDTSCGEAYVLIDGTLDENKHKYCPYCGCKIYLTPSDD